MNLKELMKYERLKRGMTQQEFADLLGVTRGTLAHYELGRIPAPAALKRISEKLGVDLAKAVIIGDKEREETNEQFKQFS